MILKKFTYPILVVIFAAMILVAWFAVLGPAQVSGSDCDSQLADCPANSDDSNFSSAVANGNVLTPTTFLPMITESCLVLFADPFDNPNSGWPEWNTNNTSVKYDNGHYRIYMKKAGYWAPPAPNRFYGPSGYKVTVEVKNISGIDGSYGLLFDINGDGPDSWAKIFEITPDGSYGIWQYNSPANWVLLASGSSSHINTGTMNNLLSVRWHNKSIVAYANGQMVKQVNVSSMQSSSAAGVSVISNDQPNLDVHYDNFLVEDPTCGPQPLAHEFSPAELGQDGTGEVLNQELLIRDDINRR